eukprot:CAMPEP_0198583682 /NCGR_PEP_ID=MMETSP1462-20131121/127068_1 /TAXON_ID=1333877 /ORGANISM="Brandtodinium nutriculum, Strain RCC3387" /LENGTH=48 /DNA_ID= /DNA_START= /DNA_END= /DNA_ORIENTATION=
MILFSGFHRLLDGGGAGDRERRRREMMASYQRDSDSGWAEKVEELARR